MFFGSTTFWRKDHRRSPMMASEITEHRSSGQMGQPAASIMDNTQDFPKKGYESSLVNAMRQVAKKWRNCSRHASARQARQYGASRKAIERQHIFHLVHSCCG
jgi:hypothetical protein